MAHIKLPEFEDMTPAIQDKARPILEETGKLGEIFKLLKHVIYGKYLMHIV